MFTHCALSPVFINGLKRFLGWLGWVLSPATRLGRKSIILTLGWGAVAAGAELSNSHKDFTSVSAGRNRDNREKQVGLVVYAHF
jgi:hypothetical protein